MSFSHEFNLTFFVTIKNESGQYEIALKALYETCINIIHVITIDIS